MNKEGYISRIAKRSAVFAVTLKVIFDIFRLLFWCAEFIL